MIRRYCRVCRKETLHDEKSDVPNEIVGRTIFGLITFGISEVLKENWFECQVCGETVDD